MDGDKKVSKWGERVRDSPPQAIKWQHDLEEEQIEQGKSKKSGSRKEVKADGGGGDTATMVMCFACIRCPQFSPALPSGIALV